VETRGQTALSARRKGGVGGDEGLEIGGGFVGDDFGFGIDAGFEGVEIEGRGGFPGDGAGAGGFLRVTAIGFDLEWRRHKVLRPGEWQANL
jgi:hypothetical protein